MLMKNQPPPLGIAGGFLYNKQSESILLQLRDGNTKVNPHHWGFFGGAIEGKETAEQGFIREFKEELDLDLKPSQLIPLCNYYNEKHNTHRYIFYVESDLPKSAMTLGEGADFDWIPLNEVEKLKLTDSTLRDLLVFKKKMKIS